MKRKLSDLCIGYTKNIALKDLEGREGDFPVYGASGFIKNIDYYVLDVPYIAIVKDGAGAGRVFICPEKSSLLGTMQYIVPRDDVDIRYLSYALQNLKLGTTFQGSTIPHIYFKDYKENEISFVPYDEQVKKASKLEQIEKAIALSNRQLSLLDEVVKSRFIEMFGDPSENSLEWPKYPLGMRCNIITGNTPSRADAGNYGSYLEWIKSDNINTPETYLTPAQEYLSEKGFKKSRYVEAGSILMTCIAGSIGCIGNVGIANRRVAFNQQINAIVPLYDDTMYIYWLMQLSKDYIQSSISMSLKGILSKRQLSSMEFPVPPIKQQKAFSAVAHQVDKSKC